MVRDRRRSANSLLLATLVCVLVMAARFTPVEACSGSSIPDVAFRGHLIGATASPSHTGLYDETFTVIEVFKGSVPKHVTIEAMPGHPGDVDDILALRTRGAFSWAFCADFDTSVMVPGRGYSPSPDPRSWPQWLVALGGTTGGVLLAGVIWRRRRA